VDDTTVRLPSDPVTQEFVGGFIGDGASAELFSFIKTANELPTPEEVIADPSGCKVPAQENLSAQYAAMQMAVHYADADTIEPLATYIFRLNRELQTSAVHQLIEKTGGALINSPALTDWVSKHSNLITATLTR
jgi:hypothetical protein